MPRLPLSLLDNATAIALRQFSSGNIRLYSSAIAEFAGHFGPISHNIAPRALSVGSQVSDQFVFDYSVALRAGDVLVITTLLGVQQTAENWYWVRGVLNYPSQHLPHKVATLERYQQG